MALTQSRPLVNRAEEADVMRVIQQSRDAPEIRAVLALLKFKEDAALREMRNATGDELVFARDRWVAFTKLSEDIRRPAFTD